MSELSCPDDRRLGELLSGQLPVEQSTEIERHVESCPRCVAALERITSVAQPWLEDFRRFASTADETPINCQRLADWIGNLSRQSRSEASNSIPQRLIETDRIGDYEVLAELRRGGMGRVFRVRQRTTREIRALKVLSSERLPRPESVERFQRESRLLLELRHQHVVRAVDSGVWRGVSFVVMEFLDGIDLDELVRWRGPLTVPDAAEVARQIALGLRYVHELKLVHRDVKPSNVMLTADRVCLLDLGLARVEDSDWDATGTTMTGEALGTLRYAAPEQLGRAHEVDARADLYGLGATLLWLLTGEPPFAGADPREVWQRKVGDRMAADPVPESLASRLEADALDLLRRLLASSPEDRPDSVDAVMDELERLSAGHRLDELARTAMAARTPMFDDNTARPTSVVMTVLDRGPRGRKTALWCAIGVGLAVLAAVLWGMRRDDVADASRIRVPEATSASQTAIPTRDASATTSPLSSQALVSEPAKLPGIDSWTIETLAPRSHLYEVAFSTDAKRYATGDDAGLVRVFDAETDRLLRMFVVGSRVRSLDWSAVGSRLAVGCSEPEVVVFDADSGRRLAHLKLEFGIAHCVRWSPDGHTLAAAGGKGFLLHDLKTGGSCEVIVPDNDGVVSLSWSPEGAHVATADRRGRLRIWNVSDGALSREFPKSSARLAHVSWSPDGAALAYSTEKGQVEVASLDEDSTWSLSEHVSAAFPLEALWLNATTLLSNDGVTLRWFELPEDRGTQSANRGTQSANRLEPTRTRMNPLQIPRPIHGGGVLHRLAVSRDGTQAVATLRFARRVWRLDLATDAQRVVGPEKLASGFDARVAWSPRGHWIAFAQQMGGLRLLDARMLELKHVLPVSDPTGSVAWSPDDARLAVIGAGQVSVFSKLDSPTPERRALPACGSVTCSWSPDGHWLATSGWGDQRRHELRLLDTATWQVASRTELAANAYLIHAWSPDGQSLACGTDQEVRLFDVATREWKQTFALGNRVNGLSWHPRERLLAAITFDGRPRVVSLDSGEMRELDALSNPATGLLWSADGQRLLVEYGRDLACLDWPAGTVRWRQPLNGHTIESLAQSTDGITLAVAIHGELRLHDSRTGRRIATFLSTSDQRWLVVNPHGHFRGSPGVEDGLLVLQESAETQTTNAFTEFASRTGWTNAPSRVDVSPDKLGWHGWPADAPPPAVAPFSAEQAARHQADWAKYLGVPVEHRSSAGLMLRLIPPGEFVMGGSDDEVAWTLKFSDPNNDHITQCAKSEQPPHRVVVTRPFYLGTCEVTQSQFESVVGHNPSQFSRTGAQPELVAKVAGLDTSQHPVENVSRSDAAEFCIQLSKREQLKPFYFRANDQVTDLAGTGYRLPTEAEWEFACRAGTTTAFWSGSQEADFLRVGWGGLNSGLRPHPVGQLPANPFGLHDTHGNVFEWVQDTWEPASYSRRSGGGVIDPVRQSSATRLYALRGGSWSPGAMFCRSAFRIGYDFGGNAHDFGIRVALPIESVRRTILRDEP